MLKNLQNNTNNNKVVLTQYPPEYNTTTGDYKKNVIRSGLYVEGFKKR